MLYREGGSVRIAVCDNHAAAAEQICTWVRQYGSLYGLDIHEIRSFTDPEQFNSWEDSFDIVFAGFGGSTGFHAIQQLRSRDRSCRVILMDDTMEYALRCKHLHCDNALLRPVEFRHIVQSMNLITEGRLI